MLVYRQYLPTLDRFNIMKTTKLFCSALLITLGLLAQSASAVVIFEDDFSGGNRNTVGNGWSEIERSNNDVAVTNGQLRLRDTQWGGIDAAASQLNGFSTIGLTDIMLSYEWGASTNTESNDSLFVEWRTSGSSWTELVEHALGGSSLVGNVLQLGMMAANQASIEFRFYTSVSASNERAYIDNVILSGSYAAVSEPGTLSLMALCLVMLAARRRLNSRA